MRTKHEELLDAMAARLNWDDDMKAAILADLQHYNPRRELSKSRAYRNIKDYRYQDAANYYDVAILYIEAFVHLAKPIKDHLDKHKQNWFIYEHRFLPIIQSDS
ncbi:hypothetical protein PG985_012643 [Apiospora marii]